MILLYETTSDRLSDRMTAVLGAKFTGCRLDVTIHRIRREETYFSNLFTGLAATCPS